MGESTLAFFFARVVSADAASQSTSRKSLLQCSVIAETKNSPLDWDQGMLLKKCSPSGYPSRRHCGVLWKRIEFVNTIPNDWQVN
jgi:hypothetical protein